MREIKLPYSPAKRRLLDASEQLFAERGFEAVSVRDITQLAKANVAAINYHFGSRDGLVSLVLAGHLPGIFEERLARLEVLEKKWPGKVVPLEELVDAFVRPLVSAVRKSELPELLSCRLLGRMFSLQGQEMPQVIEEQLKSSNDRFNKLIGKTLNALSAEEIGWRMHFVTGSMIHMLTHADAVQTKSGSAVSLEAALGRFIRFAVAGLREGVEAEPVVKKGPQATFDF